MMINDKKQAPNQSPGGQPATNIPRLKSKKSTARKGYRISRIALNAILPAARRKPRGLAEMTTELSVAAVTFRGVMRLKIQRVVTYPLDNIELRL
jgi:hypothetical protein